MLLRFPGIVTLLKYPYPRHVDELSQYETVRLHVELGPRLTELDIASPLLSVRVYKCTVLLLQT